MSDSLAEDNQGKIDPSRWVQDYGDLLYSIAYSRLNDDSAAQDVVQETFLSALKAQESFAGKSTERTWMVGILKHKITDLLRKRFRETPSDKVDILPAEQEHPYEQGGPSKGMWRPNHGPSEWGKDPHKSMEDKELRHFLQICLDQLPKRLAAVFTLYELQQEDTKKICKDLAITATNLWVMLHRCRRQLRRCLELHWIEGEPVSRTNSE